MDTMADLVTYQLRGGIATITLDDGKVNALSIAMLSQVGDALDRGVADDAVVVLTGRTGVLSAGFDLPVLRAGGEDALVLLRAGFTLAGRILSCRKPVVIACTGHAIAMGAFLVLSGDYRVGAPGPYRSPSTEGAIGRTRPRSPP